MNLRMPGVRRTVDEIGNSYKKETVKPEIGPSFAVVKSKSGGELERVK